VSRRPSGVGLALRRACATLCTALLGLASATGLARADAPARAADDPSPASSAPEAPARTLPEPYKFQPGVICPLCEITPDYPKGRSGLHWHGHWRPVGTREYITVPALALGVLALQFFVSRPDEPRARPWVQTDDCAQHPDGAACGVGGRYLSFYRLPCVSDSRALRRRPSRARE
jgi:hypothetical protein